MKANIHIHIGPGHHEEILINGLKDNGINFSYSNYHPNYSFINADGKHNASKTYGFLKYLIWGISARFKFLKKHNRHINLTYRIYDYLVSRMLNDTSLFCWPQVSLISIRKTRRKNKIVVLDYPIPHIITWQKLLDQERKKWNAGPARSKFSRVMVKRMLQEIELADYISVPSEFVYNSFIENGVKSSKLIKNNYGIDTDFFTIDKNRSKKERFTILFVGSIELRKGVHYLLGAIKLLDSKNFELRLAGTKHHDIDKFISKDDLQVKFLGQCSKEEIRKEMQNADVMVMPSILEGLSLTILECLSCGTPVISTENAGGPKLIKNGVNGFIVSNGDIDNIADRLNWCIENLDKLEKMRESCRGSVLNGFRKEDYLKRFKEDIIPRLL